MNNIKQTLDNLYVKRQDDIKDWTLNRYASLNNESKFAPIYSSVDLRNSGYKIAPVDTNLFPAGFNNLTEAGKKRASLALQQYFADRGLRIKKILLISENHTRNLPYLHNLLNLRQVISDLGIEVVIGRFDLLPDETLDLPSDAPILRAEGFSISGGELRCCSGFVPDLILLNNDLSSGMEQALEQASQSILPNPQHGWFRRRKSNHFEAYNRLMRDFAHDFEIDSWLVSTLIARCGKIDFKERVGLECVALNVDKIIHALKIKHAEYGIERAPYVFVKADNGTYGMGIMTVRSGDELLELNKKERNKMNIIKEGVKNEEVIIQEGVPTIDSYGGGAAEPLVYLVAGQVVDIFWRSNANRDDEINLNAAGMAFDALGEGELQNSDSLKLIASLASLASNMEEN
jgi:glutamate--cysteine ligase